MRSQRIVVRNGARVQAIPLEKFDWVEVQDDYVALHRGGKRWLEQQAASSVEALLDPARFVRVHRSFIVNFERVARIEPYTRDSRVVLPQDGSPAGQSLQLRAAARSRGRFARQPQLDAVTRRSRPHPAWPVLSYPVAGSGPARPISPAGAEAPIRFIPPAGASPPRLRLQ